MKSIIATLMMVCTTAFAADFARQEMGPSGQTDCAAIDSQVDLAKLQLQESLSGLTDVHQEKIARALKLSTRGTNAYEAISEKIGSVTSFAQVYAIQTAIGLVLLGR